MRLLLMLLALLLLDHTPAAAEEKYTGLAMHGKPKYDTAAKALDYINPEAPKGGVLKMAGIGTFDTVNPYTIKGKAAEGLNLVYDRLMARVWDEPFTLYPLVAEKAVMPADRSSITFTLNPKARFHDGSIMTADDVIFTFETLRDFGRPNMRRIYKLVSKVEKPNPNSVKFSFGEGFDKETGMILAMMPVLSKAYWTGKTFDQTTLEPPLLSGPYKIAAIEPGRRIEYERVKNYWAADLFVNKGHFNFDRIVYDYYRDDTIAFEAFKSGDFTLRREYDSGRWASAYKDLPAVRDGRIALDNIPHGRPEKVRSFIFNTRREPFNDIRVRKALSMLFDFEWANANLFHGQYKRISSYFPNSELAASGMPGPEEIKVLEPFKSSIDPAVFGPSYQPPTHGTPALRRQNMRDADRLLKEAGWAVENGKRMKAGKPFTFEIILSAPEDEKLALHFKRALEQMGIIPIIRVLDSAAYLGRLNAYDFDMTLYYWLSTLSPGTEQTLYWSCEAAKQEARWNFAGVCSPAVDAIAAAIAATDSRESLVAHVKTLDRILTHGHFMIPLYYSGVDMVASWKPLRHPEKPPLYGTVLESWWMDETVPAKQH